VLAAVAAAVGGAVGEFVSFDLGVLSGVGGGGDVAQKNIN
jgi:hypothetical protein